MKESILKYRRLVIILAHLLLIIISYISAFFLRFEFTLPVKYLPVIIRTLPLLIVIRMSVFYFLGLFHTSWKYMSVDDLWRILKAIFSSTAIFVLSIFFIHSMFVTSTGFPRSIFILDFILCTAFVGGTRFTVRLFKERAFKPIRLRRKRIIIIGAGEAGILTLRELRSSNRVSVEIAGLVDDDPAKKNQIIHGVKVLGNSRDIPDIVKRHQVEEIIIAIPSAKGEVIRKIVSYCQVPEIKVKIVPGLHKILNGEVEIKPREVKPEDLLGRETVEIDKEEMAVYLKDKTVLVTGAGGTIGRELCIQIAEFNPSLIIIYDINENDTYFLQLKFKIKYPHIKIKTIIGDIKDISLLKYTFSNYKPQIVFHSAAHKHVPLMEEIPSAAVKNNIIGTRNLIYASHHYNVERFILISTDKAVNPTSVMGATKRIAEMIMQAKAKLSKTKFMAVRFGNVIGSSGSVVPIFKRQIEEGDPLTVTHPEVRRYFMTASEAISLVLQAAAIGNGGEIFVLDMGEQIKIVDLAKDLVALSGLELDKDTSIKFIGLRPGEKLYEELLSDPEKDKATKHEKIYITSAGAADIGPLRIAVKELGRLAVLMAEDKIVEKMREIIPNYQPQRN